MIKVLSFKLLPRNLTPKRPSVSNPRSRKMTRHDEVSATQGQSRNAPQLMIVVASRAPSNTVGLVHLWPVLVFPAMNSRTPRPVPGLDGDRTWRTEPG